MPLESGSQLGPYLVLEPIGAGGMGEVHKATDTRLNRTVAIKVLPPRFSEDAEMRQRFEREAKVIASLNHPHICTLHDVGRQDDVDFLVMEYLEGESLAQRLERGPLPVEEALRVATEIADALDKAHAHGVTHRDLKPGNVMLTDAGAKLLDFGLSKLAQPQTGGAAEGSGTDSTIASTLPGTVLGTIPYMAPEQLEGNDAGARTDLFAFGAVLYEMLTGKRAFGGKSQALLIAAIVSADPEPLSDSVDDVPPSLEYLVTRCLAKDPEERIQTATDVLAQLKWIAGGSEAAASAAASSLGKRDKLMRWGLVAAVALVAVLIPSALGYFMGAAAPRATRFLVDVPDMPVPESIAMSPDGAVIAYAARSTGGTALFLRPTDVLQPQRVPGTEGAQRPFWSPDSRWVAFFANGQLRRVNIDGSAQPSPIVDTADFGGGTWNRDDVIVFASSAGLRRVPAGGGDPTPIASGEDMARSPWFLPDGDQYLYLAGSGDTAAVRAGSLSSDDTVEVLQAHSNAVYAQPGYLFYHREGTLFTVPFDPGSLSLSGEARRIAEGVPYSDSGAAAFSASDNGILIYRSTPPEPEVPSGAGANDVLAVPLLWVDPATGSSTGQPGAVSPWVGVDISPAADNRLAVHRHDPEGGDVWIFEPGLLEPRRLTFDATQDNSSPVWSPDGRQIAFASRRDGEWGLYVKLADNTGGEERLLASGVPLVPMSWVGEYLVYTTTGLRTASDIWYVRLTDQGDSDPVPFLEEAADERHPQLSPDGRWLAYSSNHTGRSEIYIRSFPEGGVYTDISVDGGVFPRWRRDGTELYFMNLVSLGGVLAVPLTSTETQIRKAADPRVLFQSGFLGASHSAGYAHAYAVSSDGQRFLLPGYSGDVAAPSEVGAFGRALAAAVVDRNASVSAGLDSGAPINGILNWPAILAE